MRFPRVGRGDILVGKKGLRAIGKGGSFEGEKSGDDGGINDGDDALQATGDKSEKAPAIQKELRQKAPLSLSASHLLVMSTFLWKFRT